MIQWFELWWRIFKYHFENPWNYEYNWFYSHFYSHLAFFAFHFHWYFLFNYRFWISWFASNLMLSIFQWSKRRFLRTGLRVHQEKLYSRLSSPRFFFSFNNRANDLCELSKGTWRSIPLSCGFAVASIDTGNLPLPSVPSSFSFSYHSSLLTFSHSLLSFVPFQLVASKVPSCYEREVT